MPSYVVPFLTPFLKALLLLLVALSRILNLAGKSGFAITQSCRSVRLRL